MIILPNGCKCSALTVHPKNWKTKNARTDSPWWITYRFYDGVGKSKQIQVKGMNHLTDWRDRKELTERLLQDELHDLSLGYNPFLKNRADLEETFEIDPQTPFIKALHLAYDRLKSPNPQIKSFLKIADSILKKTIFCYLPLNEIKRRHIKTLLERCEESRKLTPTSYNHYRSYLMMLFNELAEVDAIGYNPVKDVKKKPVIKKIREVLTKEERERVTAHLHAKHYNFWRYMQIFFHSGSRTAELFRVKVADVDLKNQRFKRTIIKGKEKKEVYTTIKNIALPYWSELINGAKETDYVFSRHLVPGPKQIRPDQITKRWTKYVKKELGVKKDFYSLKHLNLTQTSGILNSLDAARLAGHSDTAMIVRIYDTEHDNRQHERLKNVDNKL